MGHITNVPCYRCQATRGNFYNGKRIWKTELSPYEGCFVMAEVWNFCKRLEAPVLNFVNQACHVQVHFYVNSTMRWYFQHFHFGPIHNLLSGISKSLKDCLVRILEDEWRFTSAMVMVKRLAK